MIQQESNKKVNQFSHGEIIPENLDESIKLFTSHINQMFDAYLALCNFGMPKIESDEEKNELFEKRMMDAFNGISSITSIGFLNYIEGFVRQTSDTFTLEKVYNDVSAQLDELLTHPSKLPLNPSYPNYTSFTQASNQRILEFLAPLQKPEFKNQLTIVFTPFTADWLFNCIEENLKKTKHKIDNLFSLKKLNEKTPFQSTALVNHQKQIDKIKWQKDRALLAYLFNELKNKGIIEDKNVWQKLTAFFIDKDGKEFKNTDFPNCITSYTKGKTAHDGKKVPKEHAPITDILTILNEVIEKHKK